MRFLTLTLAALALTFSALAQPVCAPTWLWFDVEPAAGTTVESVHFWVSPLNGLAVVYAEGDLGFWNGGSTTSEAQACLPEGCYFVGLTVPEGASWEAHADFVVDDLSWEMTEMEPMYDAAGNLTGYTFCINSASGGGCDVEVAAGMTPSGAYLFEATGGPEGAYYTWYVNGAMMQSSDNPMFDWFDNLGAPTWEVCVLMDTPIGCVAETCVTPADLVQDCTLELAGGLNPSGGGVFEAYNYPDGVLINWSIDGNWLNFGGPVLELGPDMLEGVSSVCAFYESPDCPYGAWACIELETTGGGCIDESLIDPNMACTEEWNPVCGCDGNTYSNACYATYYGGVTEFTPGECGSTGGCDPVIEAWPSDVPGVWNFLVYDAANPAGGPMSDAVISWTFSTGETIEGGSADPIQVPFWGSDEVAWACVQVGCQGAVVETCWETANPNDGVECENVVIAVNVEWGTAAGIDPLELELVLSMMDVELDLDLSQILEGGSFNETLSFCLPVGFCYELEAAIGNLNALNVDLFEIAAGIGQELPAWQDVLAALTGSDASWSVSLGVDVLEACDDETGVEALVDTWGVQSYPNPTSGDMTVEAPHGTAMLLRNALGQVVDAWMQSSSRETRSWSDLPAGSYVLEADQDGTRRRTNVMILR